jgi:VCBS repeat-containing protein
MKKIIIVLLTLALSACGGGDGTPTNGSETITGVATGSVSATDTTPVTGKLGLNGSTANTSAIFATQSSLTGSFGNFTLDTVNGKWTYVIDLTKTQSIPAGSTASDTLVVRSLSGASTATVVITISHSSNSGGGSSNPIVCPSSNIKEAWLNNRLSCLTVGQVLLKNTYTTYPDATGITVDLAITINEEVYDTSFSNILGIDKKRIFSRFVCIKNAPNVSQYPNWVSQGIPKDLSDAVGGGNFSSSKPQGVSGMYFGSTGNGYEVPAIVDTCDVTKHPLILDYTTRSIVSINPDALKALHIYDY